mgnify:CR=1 FL=1
MHFFQHSQHHRWQDADRHNLVQLLLELVLLVIVIMLWPTTG